MVWMEYFWLHAQNSICLKWFTDHKVELRGSLSQTRPIKRILLSHLGVLSWTNTSWLMDLFPRITTEAKQILCNNVTKWDKDFLPLSKECEVKRLWFTWNNELGTNDKLKMFTGRLQHLDGRSFLLLSHGRCIMSA